MGKFAVLMVFAAIVAGCENKQQPDPVPEKRVNRPWEPVKIMVSHKGKLLHNRVFDGPGGFGITEAGEYEITTMPTGHGVVVRYSIGTFTSKNGEVDRIIRGEPEFAEVEIPHDGYEERTWIKPLKLTLKEGDWVDIQAYSGRWHD